MPISPTAGTHVTVLTARATSGAGSEPGWLTSPCTPYSDSSRNQAQECATPSRSQPTGLRGSRAATGAPTSANTRYVSTSGSIVSIPGRSTPRLRTPSTRPAA